MRTTHHQQQQQQPQQQPQQQQSSRRSAHGRSRRHHHHGGGAGTVPQFAPPPFMLGALPPHLLFGGPNGGPGSGGGRRGAPHAQGPFGLPPSLMALREAVVGMQRTGLPPQLLFSDRDFTAGARASLSGGLSSCCHPVRRGGLVLAAPSLGATPLSWGAAHTCAGLAADLGAASACPPRQLTDRPWRPYLGSPTPLAPPKRRRL
jgi:hypothetical protein